MPDSHVIQLKKFTGFSRMSVTTICCVWGALLLDSMLIDAFCLHITHLIDFLTCAHSKHYRRIVMSVGFTLEKLSLFSVSFVAYCLIVLHVPTTNNDSV